MGQWVPDPLPAYVVPGEAADDLQVRAEEISVALLVVLQSLSPLARAAFLLVEVFGFSAPEAGEVLGRTPTAVRQLVSRARRHLGAPEVRYAVERDQHRRTVQRFLQAASAGDLDALSEVLGEGVVLTADGGGLVSAATRPVVGRANVLGFLAGLASRFADRFELVPHTLNGDEGWLLMLDGAVDHAAMVVVDRGEITRIYLQRNPDKLTHIDPARG